MALLANSLALGVVQLARVHDGEVDMGLRVELAWVLDVFLPRPMAALATNGMADEDRLLVAIDGPFPGRHLVGMAIQTTCMYGAAAKHLTREIWRQVPFVLLRIPADGRLKEVTVALDHVGMSARAGAENILHGHGPLKDGLAGTIQTRLPVPDAIFLALDAEKRLELVVQERIIVGLVVRLRGRGLADGPQRLRHGVLAVRIGNRLVAREARRGADVADAGSDIEKLALVSQARIDRRRKRFSAVGWSSGSRVKPDGTGNARCEHGGYDQ